MKIVFLEENSSFLGAFISFSLSVFRFLRCGCRVSGGGNGCGAGQAWGEKKEGILTKVV